MSRLSNNHPVSIQPGVSNNLYTFHNYWHQTLCGSFKPCSRAAFACFCYPCYIAKLADRMGEHYCTCCINPCSLMALRTKVRTAFHIRGNLMEDYYKTTCCVCVCTAMQIEKELDYQNIPSKISK